MCLVSAIGMLNLKKVGKSRVVEGHLLSNLAKIASFPNETFVACGQFTCWS